MTKRGFSRWGCGLLLGASALVPVHAQAPEDSTAYTVAYVDVAPAARGAMNAALVRYRDASLAEDGALTVDAFEQVGLPGRYAVVEAWRDQQARDRHAAAPHVKAFHDRLQGIRLSGYDERPYKALSVAPAVGAGDGREVFVVTHVDIGPPQPGVSEVLRGLAEASRKEPGCLRFDVLQHTMRGNHFTIVEVWRDPEAFDAHAAATHTKAYRDQVQPMTGSPLDERVYRAVSAS